MQRLNNWRPALHAAVLAASGRPFDWGANDCVTFVGDCILAQTGRDIIAPWRGRYSSAIGAAKLIKKSGAASLIELVGRQLEHISRGPAFAHEGDLAAIETPGGGVGWACGIFLGARIGVLAPTGYATIERRSAGYAFTV